MRLRREWTDRSKNAAFRVLAHRPVKFRWRPLRRSRSCGSPNQGSFGVFFPASRKDGGGREGGGEQWREEGDVAMRRGGSEEVLGREQGRLPQVPIADRSFQIRLFPEEAELGPLRRICSVTRPRRGSAIERAVLLGHESIRAFRISQNRDFAAWRPVSLRARERLKVGNL